MHEEPVREEIVALINICKEWKVPPSYYLSKEYENPHIDLAIDSEVTIIALQEKAKRQKEELRRERAKNKVQLNKNEDIIIH